MVVMCAVVVARVVWCWLGSWWFRGRWFRSGRLRSRRKGRWQMRMVATEIEVEVLIEMSEFLFCIDQCCLDDGCIVQQTRSQTWLAGKHSISQDVKVNQPAEKRDVSQTLPFEIRMVSELLDCRWRWLDTVVGVLCFTDAAQKFVDVDL